MPEQHIHRTAIFTIHNPTQHIRAVLDSALALYTEAYTTILHHFSKCTIEELLGMATYGVDGKGNPHMSCQHLEKILFRREVPAIRTVLKPLCSFMRESVKAHVARTLLSYIALSKDPKQAPSYPERMRLFDVENQLHQTLNSLCLLEDDRESEARLFAQLHRTKQAEYVSIPFHRIEPERTCGLFYDPDTKRFYARLFVVSPNSHYARSIRVSGRYIDLRSGITYTAENVNGHDDVKSFDRSKASVMVVLEMGRWHEHPLPLSETAFFPQRSGDGIPATPVSASLVKHGTSYQLHVAFRFPKPDHIHVKTLLGVDRGINCLAAGAVLSLDTRQTIDTFMIDGKDLQEKQRNAEQSLSIKQKKGQNTKGDKRVTKFAEQEVAVCANMIVQLAVQYQSQVVMEDLTNFSTRPKRPKGQNRSPFNKLLGRRQYQRVLAAVNSRLALVGLSPVRLVHAGYTSLTCTQCGCIHQENRSMEDRSVFRCRECQYTTDADMQAGVNIARKTLWIALRVEEKRLGIPDQSRTPWSRFVKHFLEASRS